MSSRFPDTHDRYYVVDVFNMWQELEHYIGRRTTGTAAGNFALVPPGWKGELPAGVTRLDVDHRQDLAMGPASPHSGRGQGARFSRCKRNSVSRL